MRIAMIGQKGIPAQFGGIERHVDELSRELVRRGHEVTVYVRPWYTPEAMTEYEGVKLIFIRSWHTKNFDAITHTFLSLMHVVTTKPDVIHIHGVGPALLAWIPRLFAPRSKTVVTFHCVDRHQRKWSWFAQTMLHLGEWAACAFPHTTVVISHVLKEYCQNVYGYKTDYITNGVTPSVVPPGRALAKWDLEKEKYFLMLSRLIPHKGAHYLVKAWRSLRTFHPESIAGFKLVIAGGSHFTDEYVEELYALAEKDPTIIFTDWVRGGEVAELVSSCKLFIHPSDVEGLPIGVLEAMAVGRPVLVSDIPEHREVLPDERFWFNHGDPEDLAESLRILLKSPALLSEAAIFNQERTAKEYNWKTIAAELETLYARPR